MITFQNPRDAAWFPVVQLPTNWLVHHWYGGDMTIVAPDGRSILDVDGAVPA